METRPHFGSQSKGRGEGGTFSSKEKGGVYWERRPGPYTLQPSGLKAVFFNPVGVWPTLCQPPVITFVLLVAWQFRVRPWFPQFLGDLVQVIQPSCVRIPVIRYLG